MLVVGAKVEGVKVDVVAVAAAVSENTNGVIATEECRRDVVKVLCTELEVVVDCTEELVDEEELLVVEVSDVELLEVEVVDVESGVDVDEAAADSDVDVDEAAADSDVDVDEGADSDVDVDVGSGVDVDSDVDDGVGVGVGVGSATGILELAAAPPD